MVNTELGNLKQLVDKNTLSLNVNKTKVRIFGNRHIPANLEIKVVIDNHVFKRVTEIEFLNFRRQNKLEAANKACQS